MTTELPTPHTSPAVYREYLQRRLCWCDGTPTHASSGHQRQCPRCRTKWSYEQLTLEFRLFEEYVLGRRAADAVRLTGCAKNTALVHFHRFHAAVEEIIRDLLTEGVIATNPTSLADLRSLERALRAGSRSRRRLACRHLFFRSLTLEERTEALFESTLADEARERSERLAVFCAPAMPSVHYMPAARSSEEGSAQLANSLQALLCRESPALHPEPEWDLILTALSDSLRDCPAK